MQTTIESASTSNTVVVGGDVYPLLSFHTLVDPTHEIYKPEIKVRTQFTTLLECKAHIVSWFALCKMLT